MAPQVKKCKSCGCTDFTRDIHSASSDLACQNCGRVFEENPIVSEVTFGESSTGAATVQGAFVGADQAHAAFAGGPRGNSMDSRTKTLASAKRKIRAVATALKIPEYVSDAAYQWFSLALSNNFVKGRKSQNVIAACLYISCRKEKTHHMLIDFSARLQISVYSVGATFLKMVKALHITKLPLADPSLFIQHFAEKLDFGDDRVKIVKDAVKLAQRMSEDWIHEGRRPAGVAGACLLLAARMNNHRRTHGEIVAVAHVGEDTLQRRLNEFKETHAGSLTIKEFREQENYTPSQPPSFKKNLKKSELIMKKYSNGNEPNEEDIKNDQLGGALISKLFGSVDLNSKEILDQLERVKERQRKDIARLKSSNNLSSTPSRPGTPQVVTPAGTPGASPHGTPRPKQNGFFVREETEDPEDPLINDENRPKNLNKLPTSFDILSQIKSDEDNFDDIDDEELDNFLLTEEESKLKERVWVGLNEEYLLEQEQKRLKAEADEISGHQQPKKRKKPNTKNEDDPLNDDNVQNAINKIGEGNSVSAAARSVLTKKASKKINYMALNNLFE
ncbi:Transcription factor IIIB subunit [Wickerhamomyces ciferrii]|uniref:B-related factor 1 n=1 Tax=Wickerhamomyces ciferrii (strain ATCC 14091 / BCRC 22168 / CBS 111 / JCM 3599 / NBRC 0793 / NRRL Y-1031 F-60-10) TaxID=1206466 RepID=K0KHX0_WICCF|nr:Transcription factor IIIB subunit [Wickerhamomyces ciferrii]CCH44785.1 Transcription factor IIIB subunit [Wickerhamomyces ciferrii]